MRHLGFFTTAALLLLPLAASAQTPPSEAMRQAESHHERGIDLYEAGDYRGAIREFERAESLAHSRANLMNIARSYQQLGELDQALAWIDRYLAEPGLPFEARQRAQGLRQQLLASRAARGGGAPGQGGAAQVGGAEQLDGGRMSSARRWAWVTLGVGLALSAAGAGLLGGASSVYGEFDQARTDCTECAADLQDQADRGQALGTSGWVLLGAGAAALAASLVLFFAFDGTERRAGTARARSAPRFGFLVLGDGAALNLSGSF